MLYNLAFYFLLFLTYSICGWLIETVSCSFFQKKWVLNRGFLIGPYCPIYGVCSILMLFFLKGYMDDPVVLFILTMVLASVLEYVTSLVMEKLFKARWWDYSKKPFNIEGRICLGNAVLFGVLGIVFMYFINPFYTDLLLKLKNNTLIVIGIFCFLIFLIDIGFSFSIMTKLKLNIKNIHQDSSAVIDREMKKFIAKNHFLTKRLIAAFPKLRLSLPSGNKILSTVKKWVIEYDEAKQIRKEKIRLEKEKIRRLKAQSADQKKIQKEKEKLEKLKNQR